MTRRGTYKTETSEQIHRTNKDRVITRTTTQTVNGVTKTRTVKLTEDEKAKYIRDEEKRAKAEEKREKDYQLERNADLKKTKALFEEHGFDVSNMMPPFVDLAANSRATIGRANKAAPAATPKKTNAPKATQKSTKDEKKKQQQSNPKATKLKQHEKGTADTKPAKKLNGYSVFLKEYKPNTASLVDKIKAWKIRTTDQKAKYTRKAAAWNKKHQLTDYATTPNNSTTKAKKVTQTSTANTKLKATVFDEIIKSIDEAFDRKNTAMDKMFKSITLKQVNFPSIKIDKNVQALFNDMIFAAESIYEKAAVTGRR